MSAPQQRAWIPPDRDYDPEIVRWIGTPEQVEDWFVRDLRKSDIPDDYLIQFHEMLKRVTKRRRRRPFLLAQEQKPVS